VRLFIAFELDEAVRKQLGRLIEALRIDAARIRWVEPKNIHLTLKFLGEVPDGAVAKVCQAAGEVAAAAAPVEFRIAGVGAFPNVRAPRVIWVGVPDPPQELIAVQQALEARLAELGYRKEARRFAPHLTLGRVKGVRNRNALAGRLENFADWNADGGQYCDELTVVASELRREGPIYTAVHRAPLGGG
jgi:2'-5' RNA ligase